MPPAHPFAILSSFLKDFQLGNCALLDLIHLPATRPAAGRVTQIICHWSRNRADTAKRALPPCRGRTVSRLKSGAVMHIFPSALPNGSMKTRRPSHVFCMFDAVFHEPDSTYYLVDVLAWNGVHLCSTSLDCRSNWASTQFQHSAAAQVRALSSSCASLP